MGLIDTDEYLSVYHQLVVLILLHSGISLYGIWLLRSLVDKASGRVEKVATVHLLIAFGLHHIPGCRVKHFLKPWLFLLLMKDSAGLLAPQPTKILLLSLHGSAARPLFCAWGLNRNHLDT